MEIECPFANCTKQFIEKSSFSSHLSRVHPNLVVSCLDSKLIANIDNINSALEICVASTGDIAGPSSLTADENSDGSPEETGTVDIVESFCDMADN